MFNQASAILEEALRQQMPFVAFRDPGELHLSIVQQNSNRLHRIGNLSGQGFVFAHFNPGEPAILLSPDKIHRIELGVMQPPEFQSMRQLLEKEEERGHYIELVEKARRTIQQGALRKVVLSRKIELKVQTNSVASFKAILQWYPSAFCYLWYHPSLGLWTGASPELLFALDGEDFSTVSLAGTQPYSKEPVWGYKELEEQALVTHFIKASLQDKVNSLTISPPETVKAGALLHLRSQIAGKLGSATLRELVRVLHPTPAVCGLPRTESLEYITSNEGYDRQFYTGYLGPLQLDNHGQRARLYVNLRCMSIKAGIATIYVGGGITGSSDPRAEWQETRDKAGTMLRVLDNSEE